MMIALTGFLSHKTSLTVASLLSKGGKIKQLSFAFSTKT